MITTPNSGRKPSGRECWCSGCGEMFGGYDSFDRHRKGEYPNRKCLPPSEVVGLTKHGDVWGQAYRGPR